MEGLNEYCKLIVADKSTEEEKEAWCFATGFCTYKDYFGTKECVGTVGKSLQQEVCDKLDESNCGKDPDHPSATFCSWE